MFIFSDFLPFDTNLLLLTVNLRGYLISIAYCLFFNFVLLPTVRSHGDCLAIQIYIIVLSMIQYSVYIKHNAIHVPSTADRFLNELIWIYIICNSAIVVFGALKHSNGIDLISVSAVRCVDTCSIEPLQRLTNLSCWAGRLDPYSVETPSIGLLVWLVGHVCL